MNEWLKKLLAQIKELWSKWTVAQRAILIGIVVVIIATLFAVTRISAKPSSVPLFNTAITDETARDRITLRLAEENVETQVSAAGVISVKDEATARRMRSILVREDLVPSSVDPWALFDIERWTITDFERNINLRRSITEVVKQHIESIDDVDSANVVITMPENALFVEDQNPVTASIVLYTKPGSDLIKNRKKIEGVQKIVLKAIEGLSADNVTISDSAGNILNDFEGMAEMDNVAVTDKEQKLIQKQEAVYRAKVLNALQQTFGNDRVRDLNIKIDMDMSKQKIEAKEYSPIIIKPDNPDTPYDDSIIVESVTISSEEVHKEWKGTGYNPEGPAGVEGQNPPVYSDMSNLYGVSTESGVKKNEVINERQVSSEKRPSIDRVTVSVNIDGTWHKKYDENGKLVALNNGRLEREYIPVSDEDIAKATLLVQNAIGYDRSRGDAVSVVCIQFDRTKQFEEEDEAYFRQQQTRQTLIITGVGIAALLVAFVLFRVISREMERRRRLREEEILRRHQAERERALWEAEQQGLEVSMSVEERKRLALQENAISMAKEHPEDVALLIRTWLMEE
ncbi:MAG: flagellar M-ring protein FliF [Treponema sp.]|nr:flagellar M-ring protein FliF [Treponema sp.]